MNKQDRLIEILIQRNIFKLEDGRDLFEGSIEELARLLELGCFKTPDGLQLYDLSLSDLKELYDEHEK